MLSAFKTAFILLPIALLCVIISLLNFVLVSAGPKTKIASASVKAFANVLKKGF